MKVIASSIRKGNIVDLEDGKLYVVLNAESFHPGKGTPTTQIDMRRISDGVKTRIATRRPSRSSAPIVEDQEYLLPLPGRRRLNFMNQENYDQVAVPKDIVGDQAAVPTGRHEGHTVVFNGVAVAIQIPQRVTLEIVETEPAMKGQTASSFLQAGQAVERRPHHGAAAHSPARAS